MTKIQFPFAVLRMAVPTLMFVAVVAALSYSNDRAAAYSTTVLAMPTAANRIQIDPATGLRSAPDRDAVVGRPALRAPAVPLSSLRAERRTNGAVAVRLHGNFRSYSVATVLPSGAVKQDCFNDADLAAAAVRRVLHSDTATGHVR